MEKQNVSEIGKSPAKKSTDELNKSIKGGWVPKPNKKEDLKYKKMMKNMGIVFDEKPVGNTAS